MSDIAQISSVHPTFDTRIFEKCCKALVQQGWTVDLIIRAERAEMIDGIQIVPLPKPRGRFYRVFVTGRQAMKLALASGAKVCHVHDPELLLWTWMLTRRGRTVIFDMHENFPAALSAKDWLPKWLRPIVARVVQAIEPLLLGTKPVVLAEESYIKYYGYLRQYIVVQNFPRAQALLEIDVVKNPIPTVVYLGHIHWTRGSVSMVKAVGRLMKEGIQSQLLLIGTVPPDHRKDLQSLADELNVEVEFAGHMAPKDAWRRVAACHVGMAVLSPEPNYVTSYPTKMFEYMALGLPVVASNFPLYRRVVESEDCGFAVDPTDLDAVTDAIRTLLTDEEAAAGYSLRGREAVKERYNWEAEQPRLIDLYSSLLK